MSRSGRRKEKYGSSSEFYQNNSIEGTSARTRPFSFDEIMLRRERQKPSEDVKEGPGGAGNVSEKDIVEKDSDHLESDRSLPNDCLHSGTKHDSEDFLKVSSRRKEDTYVKEGKIVRGKEILDSRTKSRTSLKKDSDGQKGKGCEISRRVHGKRKIDKWSRDDSGNGSEKRYSKDLVDKGRYAEKGAGKSEKERKGKQRNDDERRVRGKRKNEMWSGRDSDNEYEKRQSRYLVDADRYADRNRGKSEKESKMQHHNEHDYRSRERNAGKKHDSEKLHNSEFSVRKEKNEPSRVRHEESRSKRRRSRSRERDKDKARRSLSLSPKAHKHTSYDVIEHGDPSLPSKDSLGRLDSDVDRKQISSNGSSSHHRRHGGPASRLGGYSPRRRKTEAAVKTPSPTNRSPEKRAVGWDLQTGTESRVTGSVLSKLHSSGQTVSSNTPELFSVVPVTPASIKPVVVRPNVSSSQMNVSIDSIQLTQATRPMRRLYVENLPASATDKAVLEWLNNVLLYSGVNHIQRTQPCISCIMHKEKGQALVEFLTPEDASAALAFDGRSFSGTILKIRRPKDFVELTSGDLEKQEKPLAVADSVSDIVKDSTHKIFIGGISNIISSEMLMKIASAFGPLKAYHFEVNTELSTPCAFLEYIDQSVTIKACAGLNGFRLGGQILTVVQAIPDTSLMENIGNPPFYGIPEHAKPLLEKPTQVLKLKNVLDQECLLALSELELEEILEDIRLECDRFGTVRSVNVVKESNWSTTQETCDVIEVVDQENLGGINCDFSKVGKSESLSSAKEPEGMNNAIEVDITSDDRLGRSEALSLSSTRESEEINEVMEGKRISNDKIMDNLLKDDTSKPGRSEALSSSSTREPEEVNEVTEGKNTYNDKIMDNLLKDDTPEPAVVDKDKAVEEQTGQDNSSAISGDQFGCHDDMVAISQTGYLEIENKSSVNTELKTEEDNGELKEAVSERDSSMRTELDSLEKVYTREQVSESLDVFEPGCVLVEYRRAEAACMAAHCFHGRLFDNRIVTVGYVSLDLYKSRFPK